MDAASPTPVALVTGGARRLGRHLSTALAARGFDVVILYRSSGAEAQSLVEEIRSTGRGARARVAEVFAELVRTEGRLDLLVNNVGNYDPRHLDELDPERWDATLAANLSGAFYCCHHGLALMSEGAQIINIGMTGLDGHRAEVHATDYYVSKSGLLVLTRSLAAAYGPRGVRVNMVSPGHLDNSIDLPPPGEIGRAVPLGRPGRLEEIADAVLYLLDAEYVTGANLEVSGGYRL